MAKAVDVSIIKNYNGRGSTGAWDNTYRFLGPDNLKDQAWADLINRVVISEKAIHLTRVNFLRAILRTSVKGDSKGHPENSHAIGLQGYGAVQPGGDVGEPDHTLPGEICVVGGLSGGGIRISRMLYRYAIESEAWECSTGYVRLTQQKQDTVKNALQLIKEYTDNAPNLDWLTGGDAIDVNKRVLEVSCAGVQNRQLTQQRKKGKGFVVGNETDFERLMATAREVATDLSGLFANRYVAGTALLLGGAAVRGTLRALNGSVDNMNNALDSGDYGSNPALPPGP